MGPGEYATIAGVVVVLYLVIRSTIAYHKSKQVCPKCKGQMRIRFISFPMGCRSLFCDSCGHSDIYGPEA